MNIDKLSIDDMFILYNMLVERLEPYMNSDCTKVYDDRSDEIYEDNVADFKPISKPNSKPKKKSMCSVVFNNPLANPRITYLMKFMRTVAFLKGRKHTITLNQIYHHIHKYLDSTEKKDSVKRQKWTLYKKTYKECLEKKYLRKAGPNTSRTLVITPEGLAFLKY